MILSQLDDRNAVVHLLACWTNYVMARSSLLPRVFPLGTTGWVRRSEGVSLVRGQVALFIAALFPYKDKKFCPTLHLFTNSGV